ncbi:MAG: hypothetical protein ACFCD0_07720 [Gemmataceae bacterium]
MSARIFVSLLLIIGLGIISGCQHKCCFRRSRPCPPRTVAPVPTTNPGIAPVPFPNGMAIQPSGPGPHGDSAGGAPLTPAPVDPFPNSATETPGAANRIPSGVDLGTPQPPQPTSPEESRSESGNLPPFPPGTDKRLPLPPQPPEDLFPDERSNSRKQQSPPGQIPGSQQEDESPRPDDFPPAAEKTLTPPDMPLGIPQYSIVRKGVSSGLRPGLDGGLDWLERQGFKTVIHVHGPDENEAIDRKQVEKRGMTYVGITLSPQTLTKEVVDTFSVWVTDKNRHPAFVYDKDGSLAGGLWYLYFRMTERISDEEARVRAGSAGLRRSRGEAHRDMWIAVQKFLQDQNQSMR